MYLHISQSHGLAKRYWSGPIIVWYDRTSRVIAHPRSVRITRSRSRARKNVTVGSERLINCPGGECLSA